MPKSEVTIKYSSEHVQEANVQRNTLKNIQEAWRTITQDHFKKIARKLGSLEAKSKERGVAQTFGMQCKSDPQSLCKTALEAL